jgi:hypothetical protein
LTAISRARRKVAAETEQRHVPEKRGLLHESSHERHQQSDPDQAEVPVTERDERRADGWEHERTRPVEGW